MNNKQQLCIIDQVSKTFISAKNKKTYALTDVTFTIYPGETLVILGPSGCGKTTLLRLLAGLIQPTSGSIQYPMNKHNMGFVFQSPTLLPWRCVEENITLPLELLHDTHNNMRKKAQALLEILHLEQYRDRFPHELSGGMQQRVAIARALINNPSLLFMDEPFCSLDELLRQKLNFELLRVKKEFKQTIIFVTHSVTEAVTLADRLIVFSIHPNKIKGFLEIPFQQRTPELLTKIEFLHMMNKTKELLEA